ncbi:hypothetical protein IE53DRAFT_411150 [Violaceomyces palustris]|uniref:Uncharacterized protein n=1 Tax=Violaceomyces palustris TaxID=1673888 RepID=A0ACD0NWE8_9BASI|nr:hypothetical protein IE53DRAFT_411150 [Violaceomyces palustris]
MSLVDFLLSLAILMLNLMEAFKSLSTATPSDLAKSSIQVVRSSRSKAADGTAGSLYRQVSTRHRLGSSERRLAVRNGLVLLVVWNLWVRVEPFMDNVVAWFVPFYGTFKTLFLLWLLATRSMGSALIFSRLIAPTVRPYEPMIDYTISRFKAMSRASTLLSVYLGLQLKQFFLGILSRFKKTDGKPDHGGAMEKPETSASHGQSFSKLRVPPPSAGGSKLLTPAKRADKISSSAGSHQTKVLRDPLAPHRSAPPLRSKSSVASLRSLPVPSHEPSSGGSRSNTRGNHAADRGSVVTSTGVPQTVSHLGRPPSPPVSLRQFAFIPSVNGGGNMLSSSAHEAGSVLSPSRPNIPGGFMYDGMTPLRPRFLPATDPFGHSQRIGCGTHIQAEHRDAEETVSSGSRDLTVSSSEVVVSNPRYADDSSATASPEWSQAQSLIGGSDGTTNGSVFVAPPARKRKSSSVASHTLGRGERSKDGQSQTASSPPKARLTRSRVSRSRAAHGPGVPKLRASRVEGEDEIQGPGADDGAWKRRKVSTTSRIGVRSSGSPKRSEMGKGEWDSPVPAVGSAGSVDRSGGETKKATAASKGSNGLSSGIQAKPRARRVPVAKQPAMLDAIQIEQARAKARGMVAVRAGQVEEATSERSNPNLPQVGMGAMSNRGEGAKRGVASGKIERGPRLDPEPLPSKVHRTRDVGVRRAQK